MLKNVLENKWRISFWAYTIFIIYGTSLPLDFTADTEIITFNIQRFFSVFNGDHLFSRNNDVFVNILFFIPFGLFLFSVMYHKSESKISLWTLFWITATGFSLSLFVETIQFFTPARHASVSDVLTNTLGTFIGTTLGFLLLKKGYREKIHLFSEKFLNDPSAIILILYIIILLISGLAPFDVNLSPPRISIKIQKLAHLESLSLNRPRPLFNLIFIFGTGGYILARFFRYRSLRRSGIFQMAAAVTAGFSLALIVEILQLFITSRAFSWADVFGGWIGIVYGAAAFKIFHLKSDSTIDHEEIYTNKALYIFFIINYLAFLLYKFSYPLTLNCTPELIKIKLNFFLFNVFSYVPSNRPYQLIYISLKNAVLFFPAGIILREEYYLIRRDNIRPYFWIGFIILLLMAKGLQLVNVYQTPILFDFFGMLFGMIGGYFIWKDFRELLHKKSDGD